MTWIVLVVITILALVTVSFMSGSSHFHSQPGAMVDLSFLGVGKLLMPNYDENKAGVLQDKHREVAEFVKSAKGNYKPPYGLETTSGFLLQAVKCYESIRNDAKSAVAELNLAILTKARIKIEHDRGASTELIQLLKNHFDTALDRADWFLKQSDHKYKPEVKACRNKLVRYNDGRK